MKAKKGKEKKRRLKYDDKNVKNRIKRNTIKQLIMINND